MRTDANGAFTIETIVPGEYPGRTEHIHVKVTPPGGSTLTTQLYIPGVAGNSSDQIFDEGGLLTVTETATAWSGPSRSLLQADWIRGCRTGRQPSLFRGDDPHLRLLGNVYALAAPPCGGWGLRPART